MFWDLFVTGFVVAFLIVLRFVSAYTRHFGRLIPYEIRVVGVKMA